jgi:IS5 family transposase
MDVTPILPHLGQKIGHLKAEHRMGRNYPWYRRGDAANALLAAVGYNFRHLIRWRGLLLCQILVALTATLQPAPA